MWKKTQANNYGGRGGGGKAFSVIGFKGVFFSGSNVLRFTKLFFKLGQMVSLILNCLFLMANNWTDNYGRPIVWQVGRKLTKISSVPFRNPTAELTFPGKWGKYNFKHRNKWNRPNDNNDNKTYKTILLIRQIIEIISYYNRIRLE